MKNKFDLDLTFDHIMSHDQNSTFSPFCSQLNPKTAPQKQKIKIKCQIICVKNLFYHKNVTFRCSKCPMLLFADHLSRDTRDFQTSVQMSFVNISLKNRQS